jgi:hypothetical protein
MKLFHENARTIKEKCLSLCIGNLIREIMKKDLKFAVVKFQGGFYKVSSHRGSKVNLMTVFGGRIIHKGIPETDVVEAYEEFYAHWCKSETYMCM